MQIGIYKISQKHSLKMHILAPKHYKLKPQEVKELLAELNVSLTQLPKIKAEDLAILDLKAVSGDVILIERKFNEKIINYYRVVI